MHFAPKRYASLSELTRPVPNVSTMLQSDCSHILAERIPKLLSSEHPDVARNTRIHNLGNAVVSPSGVVFIEGIALEETYKSRNFSTQQCSEMERIPTQGAVRLERAVLIDSALPRNYYHFLFDYCAKILFLKSLNIFRNFIGLSINLSEHNQSILTQLQIPRNDMYFNGSNWVSVDCLLILEQLHHGNYFSPQVISAMRNFGSSLSQDSESPRKKLYLLRQSTVHRNIENGRALEEFLIENGFSVIHLDDLSFHDQAIIFSFAETIVISNDVALANLPFCQIGTRVFEIRAPVQGNASSPLLPWRNLSRVCGLDYEEIAMSTSQEAGSSNARNRTYYVDLARVSAALQEHH